MKAILLLILVFGVFACSNSQTSLSECSANNPSGSCEEGKRCINGTCTNDDAYCSKTNLAGFCNNGQLCIEGICEDKDSNPCSTEHPNGICENNNTCINGSCVDDTYMCSENNLLGYCKNSAVCINGKCVQKACNLGDVKTCYSGDISELNKGICQPGRQICNDLGEWGECNHSIRPKAEVCDGVDNDCDGEIDDGVLNECGKCGETPLEIANNHIDDDCDGLIDENEQGIEDCDERTHQPCYTGENPSNSGKGICHGGFRDCVNGAWGTCVGQILPVNEICGDNIDNDCDGFTDEFCDFTECVAISDHENCDNYLDDDCNGLINDGCDGIIRVECSENEICGDGIDNDCKNGIDDGCTCNSSEKINCFSGDPSILNKDTVCKAGEMSCIGGESWGDCIGEILPSKEICDGIDNDCDSFIDENCPDNCANNTEICDGIDNDCDGLTDEGVLNACGTCGDSCYLINIEDNELNDNSELDGVGYVNGNITLQETHRDTNFIWIANSSDNNVHKINTQTGDKFGPFPVGTNPSRTAVTRDGGVWVGNRDSHNVTKLDSDGNHIITVNLADSCEPRGVAIDKYENVWVGCFAINGFARSRANGYVYKINSDGVIANGYPFDSHIPLYGFAIDGGGFLWSSRLTSTSGPASLLRIDTNKNPEDEGFFQKFDFDHDYQTYGIVVDFYGAIWYGGVQENSIKKVVYDSNTNSLTTTSYDVPNCNDVVRGVAIDHQNNIWAVCTGANTVHKFDNTGTHLGEYSTHGVNPIGVGIDAEGDVWVMNYSSGNAVELNNNNGSLKREFTVGAGPYSYSDITGFNLINITAPTGIFKILNDTNHEDATYDSVRVVGQIPNGSSIRVRARVSNDQSSWSNWSESVSFVDSNSDMPLTWPAPKPSGRYIQVEVTLEIGNNDDAKPKFSEIHINWQRP